MLHEGDSSGGPHRLRDWASWHPKRKRSRVSGTTPGSHVPTTLARFPPPVITRMGDGADCEPHCDRLGSTSLVRQPGKARVGDPDEEHVAADDQSDAEIQGLQNASENEKTEFYGQKIEQDRSDDKQGEAEDCNEIQMFLFTQIDSIPFHSQ